MKYHLNRVLLILCMCGCFSCSDSGVVDDEVIEKEESVQTQINKWVFAQMQRLYLWYDQLPKESSLDYDQEPSTFFYGLLADGDGKDGALYSRIEYDDSLLRSSSSSDTPSYGFYYRLIGITGTSEFLAQVLYVLPDSPAEKAGLKRGDLIIEVNGAALTRSNYSSYLETPQSSAKLLMGEMLDEHSFHETETLQIGEPTAVTEVAVYMDTVVTVQNHRIGYLMYNHFNDEYDNELREAFLKFKEAQVDDFVLDLRYNTGGNVDCAQLLATMLAPESVLGKEFIYLKFNDKVNQRQDYLFDKRVIGRGSNLNLQKLYVISGKYTASASEAVINGLKPYLKSNLIQVGETTFGKNVGQTELTNSQWSSLEVWPTAFYVYNSEDFNDYASGLAPDYSCSEGVLIGAFATDADPMFAEVLSVMNLGTTTKIRSKSSGYEEFYSSVSKDRPRCYVKAIAEQE